MAFVTVANGCILGRKLEYNVVDHCNLKCANCSHFSPYQAPGAGSLANFERDIRLLEPVYRAKRFRFVGGEPLLNRELQDFIGIVRDSSIADEIEIVTNGVLLSRIGDGLIRSVDRVSVSHYPGVVWDTDDQSRRIAQLGTQLSEERIPRFRRMDPAVPIDDDELLSSIYQTCLIAHTWSCQTFSDGYFYICSRPLYLARYLQSVGREARDFRKLDGIPLDEPDLVERIAKAISGGEPLEACRYCLGTVGKYEPWRQLKRSGVSTPSDRQDALDLISGRRLKYLMVWRRLERAVLRLIPSGRLAHLLSLVLTACIRD